MGIKKPRIWCWFWILWKSDQRHCDGKCCFFTFISLCKRFWPITFWVNFFVIFLTGSKSASNSTFFKTHSEISKKIWGWGQQFEQHNFLESLMVAKESLLKSFWAALTAFGLIVCKLDSTSKYPVLISELLKRLQKSRWKNLSSGVWLLRVHFYLRMFPPLTSFR